MSNSIIGNNNLGVVTTNTSNAQRPKASRSYGLSLTLVSMVSSVLDMRSLQNFNFVKDIQGIWIDNSANTTACEVSTPAGQNFTIPGGYQGCSFLAVNYDTPVLTFSGSGTIDIVLTNFPIPTAVWEATNITSGDTLIVSDPALEALITPNGLSVTEGVVAPIAGAGSIVTSGSAVVALTAGQISGGGLIINPGTSPLFVDLVNNAGTVSPGPNYTTIEIQPGGSFEIPPMNGTVTVNASTSGYTFVAIGYTQS